MALRGRVTLPNGLPVYGATRADARSQHLMRGYFRPGVEVRPGMTVLDVGANIGLFSLEVLQRCDGDVDLLAFEPAPQPFASLERNVHELFPGARVCLYRCALADRPGDATLYYRPRVSGTSSLANEDGGDPEAFIDAMLAEPPPEYRDVFPPWFRRLPRRMARELLRLATRWAGARVVATACTVTTVSRVLCERGIARVDFLKVDVEGAELDVLRGIEPADWPKIRTLAIEVHDIDDRVQTIAAMLATAGFQRIQVEQEWPFQGTHLYMVHAGRVASGAERPCD
jgi:FkbM family methyltransferase